MGIIAEEEISVLDGKSKLKPVEDILKLNWKEIELGSTIGFGGFSQVFRVRILQPDEQGEVDDKEYALKCLSPDTMSRTKSFKTGAVDLVIEATILSRLSHPNVIKVYGVYGDGPRTAYLQAERGYFLVIDLLADTLRDKIDKYRMQNPKLRSHSGNNNSRSTKDSTRGTSSSESLERIKSIGVDVARGMEYLHSKGVVLRDLKPDNVGFDKNGVPKIFDLGFAREFHTLKPKEVAGSLRYMAPEIALGRPTEFASDVYSFGVLLWEMVTLDKPFKHIHDRDEFIQSVMINGWRPSSSGMPSSTLRKLVKECWNGNPKSRPDFSRIVKILKVETSLIASHRKEGRAGGSMGMPLPRTTTFADTSGMMSRKNSLGKLTSFKMFSSSFLKGRGSGKKNSKGNMRDMTQRTEAAMSMMSLGGAGEGVGGEQQGSRNAQFGTKPTSTKLNPMLASSLLGSSSKSKKMSSKNKLSPGNKYGKETFKSKMQRSKSNESCPSLFEE